MIEIPAGRYGPGKTRVVDASALLRVELRLPAPIVRELTIRASHSGLSRTLYVERILEVELRRDRGDPGLPASRDGPHG